MATPNVDIEALTDEELTKLSTLCLENLQLAERVKVVMSVFTTAEDRDELSAWLEEASAEGEGEGDETEEEE